MPPARTSGTWLLRPARADFLRFFAGAWPEGAAYGQPRSPGATTNPSFAENIRIAPRVKQFAAASPGRGRGCFGRSAGSLAPESTYRGQMRCQPALAGAGKPMWRAAVINDWRSGKRRPVQPSVPRPGVRGALKIEKLKQIRFLPLAGRLANWLSSPARGW